MPAPTLRTPDVFSSSGGDAAVDGRVRQDDTVIDAAAHNSEQALQLPSTGPDPMPFDTALAAVLGYARGRRPLRFRSPDAPHGRWVQLPAFGWARFDAQPVGRSGDTDVLISEGLHGRLDRAGWADVRDALTRVRPLADAAADRAGGRAFWELPDEELSVLGEPGTVGAALREIGRTSGEHPEHVFAALHHRHPDLVPHLTRTTRRTLLAHTEEGDSGVEAVVLRELRANDTALAALEAATAALIGDARPTRLRLHDILLWLSTTLRLAHAVELGRASDEWHAHRAGGYDGTQRTSVREAR
ncbi:MAG: hypothetical protein QOI36_4357 [Pseudonocardiales bacterium]|jgi:hypothetical protein|nr:hypothetical protein [Pseudonocardia sp.]MDT7652951.1 hypothetical protein [Pseudonocardiales bacterium]